MMSYCREPKYISLLLEDYFDCLHNSKEIMVQATVSGFKKTLDQTDESCLDHWYTLERSKLKFTKKEKIEEIHHHLPKVVTLEEATKKTYLNRAGVPSLKMESSLDMRSGIRGT
ncbi:hypothetical protein Bca4012_013247 [Brassica carinata]